MGVVEGGFEGYALGRGVGFEKYFGSSFFLILNFTRWKVIQLKNERMIMLKQVMAFYFEKILNNINAMKALYKRQQGAL